MGWRSWCAMLHSAEKRFPYSSPGRGGFAYERVYANLNRSGTEQEILGEGNVTDRQWDNFH